MFGWDRGDRYLWPWRRVPHTTSCSSALALAAATLALAAAALAPTALAPAALALAPTALALAAAALALASAALAAAAAAAKLPRRRLLSRDADHTDLGE